MSTTSNGWITTDNSAGDYYQVYNDIEWDFSRDRYISPSDCDINGVSMWIDGDGNITYSHVEEIKKANKEAKLLYSVLSKLMNEIVLKKMQIGEGLKYEISSMLKEIDDGKEPEDNVFIQEEEMVI